ncbi:MAG: archaemetzincin family Zn-dependent metalloprotease [Candidatus Methanomethylicia archaeon]
MYRVLKVLIQPIGFVEPYILNHITNGLNSNFQFFNVSVSDVSLPILDDAYNPRRKQYNSSILIGYLRRYFNEYINYDKVLGVVDVDLYSDGLNFVFGEAILRGVFAIISLFRLRPEFYGYGNDVGLFFERALKEAVHELGHTIGLTHCSNRRCVMHFSNSIIDTDFKSYEFCSNCTSRIFDLIMRPKI